jgi:hypothetical protein
MYFTLSAGIKKKYIRIFYVVENNYWNLVIVSAMMIESHKYLFPVTRYMESKSMCSAFIFTVVFITVND